MKVIAEAVRGQGGQRLSPTALGWRVPFRSRPLGPGLGLTHSDTSIFYRHMLTHVIHGTAAVM